MPNNFVLIRTPDKNADFDYELSSDWYSDISSRSIPACTNDMQEDDIVYVGVRGSAVYGKGVIDEIVRIEDRVYSERDLIDYALNEARTENDLWWFNRIKYYHNEGWDTISQLKIREIKLKDKDVFKYPYYIGNYNGRNSTINKGEDFEIEKEYKKVSDIITERIDPKYRNEIYREYQMESMTHLIDIDHHVPKSIGGPGSIRENLLPIGKSLNRYKCDKVPSYLFTYAKDYGIELPIRVNPDSRNYVSDEPLKSIARKIVKKINEEDIDTVRKIYKEIKIAHHKSDA